MPLAIPAFGVHFAPMIRLFNALFLSVVLVLTSINFAHARGGHSGNSTDMVICTGTGLIILSIDENGQPVEKMVVCPDAISIFVDGFATPDMPDQALVVSFVLKRLPIAAKLGRETLSPSARGPPLGV